MWGSYVQQEKPICVMVQNWTCREWQINLDTHECIGSNTVIIHIFFVYKLLFMSIFFIAGYIL